MELLHYMYLVVIFKMGTCHVAMDHSMRRSHMFSDEDTNNIFEHSTEESGTDTHHHHHVNHGDSESDEKYCEKNSKCVNFVSCPAHVTIEKNEYCRTITGKKGICCYTGQNHTDHFTRKDSRHHIIKLDSTMLGTLSRKSSSEMAELNARSASLLITTQPPILFPGSASYTHFRNSRRFDNVDLIDVSHLAQQALEIALATKAFKDRQGVTNNQIEMGLIQEDLRMTPLGHACMNKPICPSVFINYRRIDGSCNNHFNSLWGASLTPYSRLLPPSYADGIWVPRVSHIEGKELPSPRLITMSLINDKDSYNQDFTLLLPQFGQFLTHDLTHSVDHTFENGSAISCCTKDGGAALPTDHRHYACMPIQLPKADPFYSHFKQGCMNFVRSVLAPRLDCTLGYAQQMNKLTHFIDGSAIYGSNPEQTNQLRSFQGGKMKVFNDFGRDLLPLARNHDACLTMEQGTACFEAEMMRCLDILGLNVPTLNQAKQHIKSAEENLMTQCVGGPLRSSNLKKSDTRVNQMITLVVLHIVFLREHNRIANILAELNPLWPDEKLFLEARQIVIAELQVITYKEFLPALLGDLAMEDFQLNLEEGGRYSYSYDTHVDPSILNEFSTSAFRFGHSMIDGILRVYGTKRMEEIVAIPEVMFYPSEIRRKPYLDMLLSTLTTEPIQTVDNSIPDALTKYMFRGGNPFGVDLASINIQRGRDHGLRPYNDYRELSGFPRLKAFEELSKENAKILRKLYPTVDDLDLWIGGLLEDKVPGSLLGPVFRDIIAEQFSRLKRGDRYFFENEPSVNPGHFTPDQLFELRKASMSRLICDNSDGVLLSRQAPNAFRKPGVAGNDFADCDSSIIPRINLLLWKE